MDIKKAWVSAMVLIMMLIVIVGCEDEKEAVEVKPTVPSESVVVDIEQEREIIPINYESMTNHGDW